MFFLAEPIACFQSRQTSANCCSRVHGNGKTRPAKKHHICGTSAEHEAPSLSPAKRLMSRACVPHSCQPCRRTLATQWSHVTRAAPRAADACAAPAHASALRPRSQSIARWPRRWNVRRGFFKAGERLPSAPGPDAATFAPIPGDVARRLSVTPSLRLPLPPCLPSALCPSFSLAA